MRSGRLRISSGVLDEGLMPNDNANSVLGSGLYITLGTMLMMNSLAVSIILSTLLAVDWMMEEANFS